MRKNIARVLLYTACAVLVVFYILVLWWGKNPKVGTEYRMYYLTHELTDWPGYGNLKYTFGTKEICTEHKDRNGKEQSNVCSRKGQGWQKSKRYEGTKNTDKDSYIYYIPEESADNIYLVCDITEYDTTAFGDKGIEVYVNDKLIGNIDSKGTTKLKVGYVSGDELLTVKFHADNAEYTLYSISLDKGQAET
ncbi:hypothetical protein [Lachnospira eligens]|jgi:hypothetical protein|uniref:Uncharacterized protein n=1 Tax=Lachnospira eligens TaxID=39485 RepID=A0A414D7M3_9FIRM|nr:hypothetical protein [Lachnospira eligens]RHC11898.1 hypothetical protein DW858_11725 [Lachnospira eligens]RHD06854.1 hypothetical protein DW811_11470 [Lachnospira eligens]RHM09773.1 hypothetical protein DWZ79_12380 [Lachnospira eligens]